MAKEVKILENFRDDVLLKNAVGRALVKSYYKVSPQAADFIANHDSLKMLVRWSLLPLLGISWVALNFGFFSTISMIILLLSLVVSIIVFCYRKENFIRF